MFSKTIKQDESHAVYKCQAKLKQTHILYKNHKIRQDDISRMLKRCRKWDNEANDVVIEKPTYANSNTKSNQPSITFQALSIKVDKNTGIIKVRGRGDDDKAYGVVIEGHLTGFYISRQLPFRSEEDAAITLSIIEEGLRNVASKNDMKRDGSFQSPAPSYSSKSSKPQTVKVPEKLFEEDEDGRNHACKDGSLFHSWAFVEQQRKTMYGKTPTHYRENVIWVRLNSPSIQRLILQYIESDNFLTYHQRMTGVTMNDFTRGYMLRTFNGTIIDIDLEFRLKYGLCMARWWTVSKYTFLRGEEKSIVSDVCLRCLCTDIICDTKREDNANIVRMGWDIECAAKINVSGEPRFPIAAWNNFKFTWYANQVLNLPRPKLLKGFNKNSKSKTSTNSISNFNTKTQVKGNGKNRFSTTQPFVYKEKQNDNNGKDDGDDEELYDGLFQLESLMSEENENKMEEEEEEEQREEECPVIEYSDITPEEEDELEEEDANGSMIFNNTDGTRWASETKGWTENDWIEWLTFALDKVYSVEELKYMVSNISLQDVENIKSKKPLIDLLLPDPKDTDPVTIICCATKRINTDTDLKWSDTVAFIYNNPNTEDIVSYTKKEIKGIDRGANIWNFDNIKINTFQSEAEMINAFINYRKNLGPDIEETWNGRANFDLPYLYDRLLFLQKYGTKRDKDFAFDINFTFELGHKVKSIYTERFSSSRAGGDKMERLVSTDLLIHNDGCDIIKNSSFGEKRIDNSLDSVSMDKLTYSRMNTNQVVEKMIEQNMINEEAINYLYRKKMKLNNTQGINHIELKERCNIVYNDFPMRKMQFDIKEGTERWNQGGAKLREFMEYCFVDAALPSLIGGKLSLQIELAKAANIPLDAVFYRGVQIKVLSIIYGICQRDFKGLFMIPDKGNLHLHWPGVFNDFELGFEEAVLQDPRLKSQVYAPVFIHRSERKAYDKKKASEKKCTYKGAYVLSPLHRGVIHQCVPTLDYASLYPSIMLAFLLCFTTFLTSKSIEQYGFEEWEYTTHVLGTSKDISCGEAIYDPVLAKKEGYYHTNDLKIAYFYSAEAEETIMGVLVKQTKKLRGAAKGKMGDCKKAIEILETLVDDHDVDSIVLKSSKHISEIVLEENTKMKELMEVLKGLYNSVFYNDIIKNGQPAAVVLLKANRFYDQYDNEQNSHKIIMNSSYGYPSVNPSQANLPMMEIGSCVTKIGRSMIRYAKAVSERITSKTIKRCAKLKNKVIERQDEYLKQSDCNDGKMPYNLKNYKRTIRDQTVSALNNSSLAPLVDLKRGVKKIPLTIDKDESEESKKKRSEWYKQRQPEIDCSDYLLVPKGWVKKRADLYISQYKDDVLYGDTDSVMIKMNEKKFLGRSINNVRLAYESTRTLVHIINSCLFGEMSIVLEKMAIGMLMEDKKRYTMVIVNEFTGKVSYVLVKGTTIKRDTLPFVKNIICNDNLKILDAAGTGGDVSAAINDAVDNVKSQMRDLLYDKIDLDDITIHKRITKLCYKVKGEHVIVADAMKQRGETKGPGDVIHYSYVFKDYQYITPKNNKKQSTMQNTIKAQKNKGDERNVEDVNYIKEKGLTLDIRHLFEHRIWKPLSSYFANFLNPRDDFPYIDDITMSPEQMEAAEKVKEKIKSEQQKHTRHILFDEFLRLLTEKEEALKTNKFTDSQRLYKNTLHNYIKSSTITDPSKNRYHQCTTCYKIENRSCDQKKMNIRFKPGVLPPYICDQCYHEKDKMIEDIGNQIKNINLTVESSNQLCRGCAYLLDNPDLDIDKCKSAQCSVHQVKFAAMHKKNVLIDQLTRLKTTCNNSSN